MSQELKVKWKPPFQIIKQYAYFSPTGPCQGMSDRARAAEALMEEYNVLLEDIKQTNKKNLICEEISVAEIYLTCINSQHIWIIGAIDC